MPIAAVSNLTVAFGATTILRGASVAIDPGERVGLLGRNGTGKSTLLRCIAGLLTPDEGSIVLQRGTRPVYLSQDPVFAPGRTLRDAAGAGFAELHDLRDRLDRVFAELATVGPSNPDRTRVLLADQARLESEVDRAGGYAIDHRIDEVLHGLGFTDRDFTLPTEGLSGGQRARLALAQALLSQPDLMLLDEPTNHLDIAGREWLESFLGDEFRGAVLMVTHDRYVLDRVVTRIVELESGRLIDYPGRYESYREVRAQRRLTMQRAFDRQQTKFKQEEAYIRRYKAGQRAKQARGRETRLEREKRDMALERPPELDVLSLRLPKAPRTGDLAVIIRQAAKSYPVGAGDDAGAGGPPASPGERRVLFDRLDVVIGRGERWGIIGPNGAGKSTLVRAIMGEIGLDSGTIRLGSNVRLGYFRQHADHLDGDLPVFRYLQDVIRREVSGDLATEQAARDLAGAFLFTGPDQERPLGQLSGGERSRAMLAGLLASAKNLLILDEPTNHLDIPSAERLEQALARPDEGGAYEGTLILISHDRALIDATCDHLLVFDGRGGVEVFPGDYSDWHERVEQRRRDADPRRPDSRPAPPRPAAATSAPEQTAARPRVRNPYSWMTIDQVEARVTDAGARLAAIDAEMARPEVYSDHARCQNLLEERGTIRAELDGLEAEWLRRADSSS